MLDTGRAESVTMLCVKILAIWISFICSWPLYIWPLWSRISPGSSVPGLIKRGLYSADSIRVSTECRTASVGTSLGGRWPTCCTFFVYVFLNFWIIHVSGKPHVSSLRVLYELIQSAYRMWLCVSKGRPQLFRIATKKKEKKTQKRTEKKRPPSP